MKDIVSFYLFAREFPYWKPVIFVGIVFVIILIFYSVCNKRNCTAVHAINPDNSSENIGQARMKYTKKSDYMYISEQAYKKAGTRQCIAFPIRYAKKNQEKYLIICMPNGENIITESAPIVKFKMILEGENRWKNTTEVFHVLN